MKYYKDLIRIIENKSLPILFLLSLFFLPTIVNSWSKFFPQNWLLTIIISILWVGALYFHWRERKEWNRKTRLISYLKRHGPWRSIHHLTTEWEAKEDYSEKIIKNLIAKYPNELNDVSMKSHGAGVGINKVNDKR